ncbi:hypothetical protein ES319_D01G183900v1 [Gossypium barbadense]|uniref:Uncharacterized protein n=1 Tax=Gossypium barbadense TaxID=3634 RepID=A0A5J5SVI8_GOSBA|nr:hypothetical protein ES319_D01G183900v1 [Gossypium barbadense]
MSEFHDLENSGTVDNRPIYPQSSTNQVQLKSQVELSHVDSREDLFVDAPDELNNDNKEGGMPAVSPNVAVSEGKRNAVARLFDETDNNDSNHFVNEMEHLRALLEQAVDEKERLEVKYKEEMEVLSREIHMKDQEIERLNARDISSVAEAGKEVFTEKNRLYEVTMERILAALAGEQVDLVEKSMLALIEKQCLTKAEYDFGVQEFGTLFVAVRDELFELRRKEALLVEKIGLLEDENRKFVEQVENEKVTVNTLNSKLGKTKAECEEEKMKCANTKEKLNLAVTKGKSLVQQRDALKQSLADKAKKTSALEAAESHNVELVKSENLTLIVETFEHILSHLDVPEELQSVDIVGRARWLANERNELKGASLDFCRLKDSICAIDLPENVSFSDLGSRLAWLKESFYRAKDDINMLQNEMSRTKETASDEIDKLSALRSAVQQEKDYIMEELDHLRIKNDEIVAKAEQISLDKDHLSDSLAAELTEKDKIQKELDDLTNKYENIVGKGHQLSSEKDQMFRLLVEGSGKVMGDQEVIEETSSNLPVLIDRCLEKLKEQTSPSVETPFVDAELFEKYQSLLYVRDLELMLCKEILEEDMLVWSQLNDLSNQFRVTSQELFSLKEEKDVLQKDLERSEEKAGLVREKLTMAVKKGKGLVQDRDNLKILLEEKKVAECRDQINTLSADLERVPKLESNLVAMKEERDQLEKFLTESNSILQRVVESIDRIVIPVDSEFLEPVEKLDLLAGYFGDCRTANTQTEQELMEVKEESSNLAGKLAQAQETMKLLEDALAVVKNDLSQLAEEKKEMEFDKKHIEIELQKTIEEARLLEEACDARKSLEEALSQAENKTSVLITEKEDVQGNKSASDMEVEKMREEIAIQTSRLAEAYNTITTLENALSLAEKTVASLTEQNNNAQVEITNLDNELKKLKNETDTHTSQLKDAGITIKLLDNVLAKAENDFSALLGEKRTADQEVSTLNSKLNVCMEELAGSSGNLASRSMELIGHLNNLQMLAKDQSLLEYLFDKDLKLQQGYPFSEDIASLLRQFSDDIDNTLNIEMENDEANAINALDVSLCFRRVTEGFQMRNKILADRFEGFSSFLDESIATLLKKLQAIEDEVKSMIKHKESFKQEYVQKELDDLTSKYEKVVEKVHQLSLEKDQMVQLLVEGSGIVIGEQEGTEEASSNLPGLIYRCLEKIKERSASLETPFVDKDHFENFQSLLYVRGLELMLCEEILEEDMLVRSQLNDLSNQFKVTSQELFALKEEKDVLQKGLEQSEEKSGLLKEKLSMAVKKGKGLVQDREKLKVLMEEKMSEIEKLRLELQQEESRFAECGEQISSLSADLDRSLKLESNLASMKEEKDQLEKLLFESNRRLHTVVESINCIVIPVDSAFLEPVQKLNLLSEYIYDCQTAKKQTEQELREVKEEASILAGKLAEARATMKLLEDALNTVKNDLAQLAGEKNEMETGKKNIEIELQKTIEQRDESQSRVFKLESDVEGLEGSCREMRLKIEDYQAKEDRWKEKEAELLSSYNSLLMKVKEAEEPLLSASQLRTLMEMLSGIEIPLVESEDLEPHISADVKKLFSVIVYLSRQNFEIQHLKGEIETHVRNKPDLEHMKMELSEVTFGLEKIIVVLGGKEFIGGQNSVGMKVLLPVLEKQVNAFLLEAKTSKSKAEELGTKLAGSQKVVNELSTKVKLLEDSIQGRTVPPEVVQERSIFEAPSASTGSEISEIEDLGSFGKNPISSAPLAAHVRTMRKGSTDHLALNIDSEADRLINSKETDKQKCRSFNSLNTSGLIPKQGKLIADRVDGIWVSGGQVLSSRPRARLGLIAYCLLLHIWLLGTVL